MCGRDYSTYTDEELLFRYLNRRPWPWKIDKKIPLFKPNYNMCPTQKGLVLGVFEGELAFREMRWGLVPGWANSVKDADRYSMINAKAEEVSEKRSYKSPFQKRRCVVPVSGFYEWKRSGESKIPYAIHLKNEPIMSFGGLWEHWEDKESGEVVESFSILTMAANAFMSGIHTRMPLILSKKEEEGWLDPTITAPDKIFPLMKGEEANELTAFEVSNRVNSPKNNSAQNLEPD